MNSPQDEDKQDKAVTWAIIIGAVLLAISLALGVGVYRTMAQSGKGADGQELKDMVANSHHRHGMPPVQQVDAHAAVPLTAGQAGDVASAAQSGAPGLHTGAGVGDSDAPSPAAVGVPNAAASGSGDAGAPAANDGDAASVRVEGGVVKFYFASGSADLAAGAPAALADVVKGVAAGGKAVISGFHDTTGSAQFNAELAKQRALAVREALLALGVGEDKVDLKKPEVTAAGAGNNAEARRVEVRVE